jgi:transcriptional regulator with XRE-family HTH domain
MRDKHAEFLKLIAIRVRQLRGEESQDSVCYRAGVSRRVLADIERGTRDFQITSLLRILSALNTDLPGILGVTDPEAAGRLHSKLICRQVHDLLALGGEVETMITTAVEQWHRQLVHTHAASAAKHHR